MLSGSLRLGILLQFLTGTKLGLGEAAVLDSLRFRLLPLGLAETAHPAALKSLRLRVVVQILAWTMLRLEEAAVLDRLRSGILPHVPT